MKKIGDYMTLFSIFIFSSKRWLGTKKKIRIRKMVAIFKRKNFLNIGKKQNTLAFNHQSAANSKGLQSATNFLHSLRA
jgi:hypothetical protein